MRVLYVTAVAPCGVGEEFVLTEIQALRKFGVDVRILPRDGGRRPVMGSAAEYSSIVYHVKLFGVGTLAALFVCMLSKPFRVTELFTRIVRCSPSARVAIKNIAVLPMAAAVTRLVQRAGITHLHCHWGGTTATIAYAVSRLSGVPWSLTLHRWDISENNMLREKALSARFVRCISEQGRQEILARIGSELAGKVCVVHMGVNLRCADTVTADRHLGFRFAVPAAMIAKKGHLCLLDACALLVKRGISEFLVDCFGDGPLRTRVEAAARSKGLETLVKLHGHLGHAELLERYEAAEIDAVVLPSLHTPDGHYEGIPVALMEPMACGIPVISTVSGAIPELVDDTCGILVPPNDSAALADAMARLMSDPTLVRTLGANARDRVRSNFAAESAAGWLVSHFESASA